MDNMHNIPLLFLSLGIPEWYASTSSSLVDGNMIFKKKEDPAERMMCFNLYSSHSNLLFRSIKVSFLSASHCEEQKGGYRMHKNCGN